MKRNLVPEDMDDELLNPKDHVHALTGLARINVLSGSAFTVWKAIRDLARENPGKRLRMLDIATGSGDIPISIWKKARKDGIALEIDACDKSKQALAFARNLAHKNRAQVHFFELNIKDQEIPGGYDILTSSLFLHHLENDEAAQFLKKMAQKAERMVLVNDLARSVPGVILAYLGVHVLTTSPIVHTDGVRSARAAFSIAEIKQMLHKAGLNQASVISRWPSRFLLTWKKRSSVQ